MDIINLIKYLAIGLVIWCAVWFLYGFFKAIWRDLNKPKNIASRHQALLNNCTDNDEAILHKREIEKNKNRGDRLNEYEKSGRVDF